MDMKVAGILLVTAGFVAVVIGLSMSGTVTEDRYLCTLGEMEGEVVSDFDECDGTYERLGTEEVDSQLKTPVTMAGVVLLMVGGVLSISE